jgi:hypothetical protein
MDSYLAARVAQHPARCRGCALSKCGGLTRTPGGGSTLPATDDITRRNRPGHSPARGSLFCYDVTERPIPRPHDATEQKTSDRGKKKRHMLKNLLLIKRALRIRCLSETHPGSVHDKRIARYHPLSAAARESAAARFGLSSIQASGRGHPPTPEGAPWARVDVGTESRGIGGLLGGTCASNMSTAVSNAAECSKSHPNVESRDSRHGDGNRLGTA